MKNNLTKNFLINCIKVLINLLFPLITFPYVSRVLLPEGIGRITYIQSIVNYFLVFINLGIPLYGVREIAKVKNNYLEKSKVFSEILVLNFGTTILGSFVYFLFCKMNIFKNDINIFLVFSIVVILNFLNVEWFFQGIENYTYITIRTVIMKIISLILLLKFVKEEKDIYIYSIILVFSLVGSNFFNIYKSLKKVKLTLVNLNIKRHLKGIFIIFSMNLAISIYTNLDSVMLGSYGSKYSLGIYSAASKIIHLILGIITSLSAVLLPRISNYIYEKKEKEIKLILEKTITFLIAIIFPSLMGIYFISNEIINIFAGNKYSEAIITLKILSLITFFVGFSNFIGIQILYPRGEEKKVFYSVLLGAIANFLLNLYLIPKYFQNGAAIATCIAEFSVLIFQIYIGKNYLNFKILSLNNLKFVIATIGMGVFLYFIQEINYNLLLKLLIKVGFGIIIYFIILIALKEENIYFFIKNNKKE